MKKLLCIFLSLIMIFSTTVVAFAGNEKINVDGYTEIPVVVVSGDGSALVNKDGNTALQYKNLLSEEFRDDFINQITGGLKDLIYPLVVEGFLTDNWDNFYDTLYDVISDIFKETLLDKNGEVPTDPNSPGYKTDINPWSYQQNIDSLAKKYENGEKFNAWSYVFQYDWRLDPFVTVQKLHEYIQGVKKSTGVNKVGLIGRCLGSSIVATYVSVYGMEDLIGVAFNGSVVNGAEVLSQTISGKFEVDMNAIIRFLEDSKAVGLFSVDQLVIDLLNMLEKSGFYGLAKTTAEKTLYAKLVDGVTSALALSTFFTWPTYWTAISPEDYQDALYYVFGPEGSEKRKEYAGLIEKLDHYDREVRQKLPEIYKTIDKGGNLGIMSKYELQIVPICKAYEEIGDQFASVTKTSVGATTANLYETFSEDYIAKRIVEGKGKYISPDKQIDASTCSYPDYTWFVKGSSHSNWTYYENAILQEVVTADKQITVDDTIYTQFMVYDYGTDTMTAMTKDNCQKVYWTADKDYDKPENIFARVKVFTVSVVRFIKELSKNIMGKLSEKINTPKAA